VARCAVERLVRRTGLRGAARGKETRTTVPDKAAPCPADKVNRRFRAPRPNLLWLSDSTYVATWQGFVCVAFVVDAFARRIVGRRVRRCGPPAGSGHGGGTPWRVVSGSAGLS
jgi:putative transposase